MTKIIVTPIDNSAPGSYRERRRLLKAFARVTSAADEMSKDDLLALVSAREELDAIILEHAETDDGSSLEDALDEISNDDFNALFSAIMSGETVPNPSSAS